MVVISLNEYLSSLGIHLEELLQRYRRSLDGGDVPVPREILALATHLSDKRLAGVNLGPADCVPDTGEADLQRQSTDPSAMALRKEIDVSCDVSDDGIENVTPLQIWLKLLKKLNDMEEVEDRMKDAVPAGDDEKAQLMREEAFVLSEALAELHKLASKEVRERFLPHLAWPAAPSQHEDWSQTGVAQLY